MFWFNMNRLVGSYFDLILTSRSQVPSGNAERIRAAPSSPRKLTYAASFAGRMALARWVTHMRSAMRSDSPLENAVTLTRIGFDRCANAVAPAGTRDIAPP